MEDDDRLIAAVAAGDDGALRALFERHAPWLAGRLRRALPAGAVEDVLQETFIAVWRGAGSYRADGEAGAWLWGIARRQVAMWARKTGRPHLPLELLPSAAEDPATVAVRSVDLQRAFAALGPEGSAERELARLVFVEDWPVAEVAAHFDIPQGTVKSRVFRLRRSLQAALGGRGGTRSGS
jgi:RNA polymerase sigma-70 factor (ECF subfamily)